MSIPGFEEDRITAECKLWRAVLLMAAYDSEQIYMQVKRQREKYGGASMALKREIERLDHEFSSEWFREICEFADINHGSFKTFIGKLRLKYKIDRGLWLSKYDFLRMPKPRPGHTH